MSEIITSQDHEIAEAEALKIFEREIGANGVKTTLVPAGDQAFLKFVVGREAPLYRHALRQTQKLLDQENPYRGALGLHAERVDRFPESLEALALITLLTRSTRAVAACATRKSRRCWAPGSWQIYTDQARCRNTACFDSYSCCNRQSSLLEFDRRRSGSRTVI